MYFEWPFTFGRVSAAGAAHTVCTVVFGLFSETCNFLFARENFLPRAKFFSRELARAAKIFESRKILRLAPQCKLLVAMSQATSPKNFFLKRKKFFPTYKKWEFLSGLVLIEIDRMS